MEHEHRCTKSASVRILWRTDHWSIVDSTGWPRFGITHCPYCGVKLEPPDVKIEVSRKALLNWASRLDLANSELLGGWLRTEVSTFIGAIAICIRTAALND